MTGPVEVHHLAEGPPDAPALILAHAIGTSLLMWEPQARALSGEVRVVRYDQRGHGRSPVPAGPYTIADLGGDLLALMDRQAIERAAICGQSLGAMTALWVAAHAPERVERIVASGVIARPSSPQAWAERAGLVRRNGTAAVVDLVLERWGYRDRDPRMAALVRDALLATPAEGYAACCDAIKVMDLEPDLPAIAAPTLIVAGADDPAAPPAEAQRIAALIPGAAVRVIPGVGHLPNVERPEAVTAAIREHLAPVPQRRQA
jgi:3-oxoadipate enol-lactonase